MGGNSPSNALTRRRCQLRRMEMLAAGLAALASLCLVGASSARAQLLDGTTHEVKLNSSAVAYLPMVGLVKEGGKVTLPVVLRSGGADPDFGGFGYMIHALSGPGPGPCVETPLGTLFTYTGEGEGLVTLLVANFPEPGQNLRGHLFVEVKTKPGSTGLKTVAGWTEVEDGAAPDPDGISKKAQLKAKEKDPTKLVDCIVP
jgi:hypothetical protein